MLIVLILVMVDLIIINTVTAVDTARYTVITILDGENAPSVNVRCAKFILMTAGPTVPLL